MSGLLNSLLNKLTARPDMKVESGDCRMALTVMLVRIARADREYTKSERERILAILKSRYDLDDCAAEGVLVEAEATEAEALDIVQFTRVLKDRVPYDEREEVLAAFWRVVLDDDYRDDEEDRLLRLAAKLLGVSDRDSGLIRRKVMQEIARSRQT
ncbi:MAG: TerB family tellurite resistance protein [Rhodobacteraceae bacterium]|nr:TerB family tellurite resistance protein [Paracoccaceae bacterium]